MDIKNARRKTFDVEYVVVTQENLSEVEAWCEGTVGGEGEDSFIKLNDKNAMNARQTKAFIGDYVLKYGASFKSFGKKAFYKSFEDVVASGENVAHSNKIARSAKSGQFVTPDEAVRNPDTTVIEEIPRETKLKGVDFSGDTQVVLPDATGEVKEFDELAPGETPTEDLRGL